MSNKRIVKDLWAGRAMSSLSFLGGAIILLIAASLIAKSSLILGSKGLTGLLFSVKWHPSEGYFGFGPFILGTIWVTAVAMALAVPASLMFAIYISDYSRKKTREALKPVLDLLGGISPVIFGVFGVITVVPFIKNVVVPAARFLNFIPLFRSENFTGFNILSAGIVLAIMIFPTITSVAEEVIHSVPYEARESSLALGATKWETIKYVIVKKAGSGIVAAIMLGLSRAFGETIAVLMVVGNVVQIPHSVFDAAYTLPALIANNYGEMMSIPLYDSALLLAALILLAVTVLFNVAAWGILFRIEREYV